MWPGMLLSRSISNRMLSCLLILAAHGICLGQIGGSPATDPCFDVTLDESGAINGVLVNSGGVPVANSRVRVRGRDNFDASTRTSLDGSFALGVKQGGIYSISCESAQPQTCRAWIHGTAPPSARNRILFIDKVSGGQSTTTCLVRGQGPLTPMPEPLTPMPEGVVPFHQQNGPQLQQGSDPQFIPPAQRPALFRRRTVTAATEVTSSLAVVWVALTIFSSKQLPCGSCTRHLTRTTQVSFVPDPSGSATALRGAAGAIGVSSTSAFCDDMSESTEGLVRGCEEEEIDKLIRLIRAFIFFHSLSVSSDALRSLAAIRPCNYAIVGGLCFYCPQNAGERQHAHSVDIAAAYNTQRHGRCGSHNRFLRQGSGFSE